jgi:hypothetical protein
MTTALKFRNIDASPDDPIETWPFEGILAAVERGTLPDWRRLAAAIRAIQAGFRGKDRNLAIPLVDLYVR